ncbi:MAG: O-antigen ligase family protein [Bacteroidales bacterium]|nr:O-antigen ligase family protein [Bacteroidales bacterium]
MSERKTRFLLLLSGAVFLIANLVAIRYEIFDIPYLVALPVVLYLLVFKFDWLMYLLALLTPLSVLKGDNQLTLSIPSEPLMILLSLLFVARLLYDMPLNIKVLKHPVTVAIFVYFAWLVVTTFTSELPWVSIKFILSRLWFVLPCYFLFIQGFQDNDKGIVTFFTCHAIGIGVVVCLTTIQHAMHGFSEESGHWVMSPFYNDHTAYGAALAFMLPITLTLSCRPRLKKWQRGLYLTLSFLFLAGLYLGYSRASWLSLVGMIGLWVLLKLRIKFSWCAAAAVILGVFFYLYADDILYKMGKNTQDVSGNLSEQIQSMSNISTDASNVERINRWVAAKGMIEDRPVVGWGAGTYQFVYAPFQKNKYKTIITTNFGDGGNAHSEYIGPWAETGTIGFLTVLILYALILYYGIMAYIKGTTTETRLLALGVTLALFGYFIHGFLNNFLDTDKLALPFWSACAAIVMSKHHLKHDK